MYYYTIVDKIVGEVLHFADLPDAEREIDRRVSKYKSGRRPINVKVEESKKGQYAICSANMQ